MPCAWTRGSTGESGKKGRVFHSTPSAFEDILDPGYRRLFVNGIFRAAGLEEKIKPDLTGFGSPVMPQGKCGCFGGARRG